MKPTHKIIKLVFPLCMIFLGQNAFGQVPPYHNSFSKISNMEAIRMMYNQTYNLRKATANKSKIAISPDSITVYYKSDIPFYTVFNYSSIKDYELETNLKLFKYRLYSSFKAPKGIRKITYHLNNNFIDSIKPSKHIFYFNRKSHRIEKEEKYEKDMISSIDWRTVDIEEYFYSYNQTNEHFIIKKFLQTKDSLVLIQKHTYSQDKTKLLEVELLSRESHLDMIDNMSNKKPSRKHIAFQYNDFNEIINIDIGNTNIRTQNQSNIINYETLPKDLHKWSRKQNWVSLLGIKTIDSNNISFPDILNLNLTNNSINLVIDNLPYSNQIESLNIKMEQSSNVYLNNYREKVSEIITSNDYSEKVGQFSRMNLFLLNKFNKISSAYFVSSFYRKEVCNYELLSYSNRTPTNYIFVLNTPNKPNNYTVKNIVKEDLGTIDIFKQEESKPFKYILNNLELYNKSKTLRESVFTIELKNKKGIDEIYFVKGNKKYPLLTVN